MENLIKDNDKIISNYLLQLDIIMVDFDFN